MALEIAYLIAFFYLKIIPMLVSHFTVDVCAVILGVIYIVQDFPHLLQSFGHLVLPTRKSLYSNPRTSVYIVWFFCTRFFLNNQGNEFYGQNMELKPKTNRTLQYFISKQTKSLTSCLCIFSAIRWILELLPCIHKWPSWDMAGAARFFTISSHLTSLWKWAIDIH